jgi:exopolysaccharide production protein ExoQ
MPPQLASVLTLGFIVYLFRRDFREKPNVTSAIWLPIIWIFIIASRTVSQWVSIFGVSGFTASSVQEGSSLDAAVFLGLTALGIYVLSRRQVRLSEVVHDNPWLALFLLYCFFAIFWSDFPFVSFKRWIKLLGHPVMVLIVFTEPDPANALLRVMKRCAYVIIPVSILWMKYYPALGRATSEWGGVTNRGIAGGKNELGGICFIFALFFIWHLLQVLRTQRSNGRRDELRLTMGLLLLIGYCLRKAHSSTSTISLVLGILVMMLLGLRFVNKRQVGVYAVTAIAAFVVAQVTFDLYGSIVDLTGHENTIEGRGRLWETVLATDTNPMFGTGFESYWLGDRIQKIWEMPEFRWHPNQAHNGYIETYLNLGAVGLSLLVVLIIVTCFKCKQELLRAPEWGRLTTGYLIGILAHNWTEAGFKGLSIIFFFFYLIVINYSKLRIDFLTPMYNAGSPAEDRQLIHC